MDEAERRIAQAHGEATLEVLAFNTGAIAFYEGRGWVKRRACMIDECGETVDGFQMIRTLR